MGKRAANTMGTMRRSLSWGISLLLGFSAGALLGACGSSTKTVSVAATPTLSQTTGPSGTSSTPARPSGGTAAQTTTNGGTPAPTSTRSAPEPAFTQKEAAVEGLSAAAAVLRANGFTPNNSSDYHSNQALRVLVGTRTASQDGYGQQAFFFVNGRYIGTDSKQPSASVHVVAQGDTEVTLAYPLYRKGDPLSSPTGGKAQVRFQLNNGKLVPLGTIPPANSATGLSRQ
jgi:LppP/LprE lipoprotein